MKRKLLLAAMMLSMGLSLSAESGTCGEHLTWDLTDGVLTISGMGDMESSPWGSYRESIKTVTIEDGVTSIGNFAFEGCSSLISVTIGNSVTSIGSNAFSVCSSLTSVTIGNSVTNIGRQAFSSCTGLTSVTIPNSVTSIGDWAFQSCCGLTSVTLNSNTIVGKDYEYNSYIKSIFGEQVTEYILGDEITSIGDYAFLECSSLTSVTIPNSVTSIGEKAFYFCSSLTSVTIPNSVTSIGNYAFEDCSSLTSVTIPNSVTSIGDGAFRECRSLTTVTIPNSVTSIGNSAFSGCSSLTSVTIPNSVTSIGYSAFSGCSGLTSVTIPNSVTSIGNGAFYGCSGLTSLSVEAGNTVYDSRNNCNAIIETATNTLILGSKNTTIPNSVTSIGENAFYNCTGLTSVTIPNSVTSIGDYTFYNCYSLTSVTIPNSVTSIGKYAFSVCSSLTSVTIPNSVTSIGEGAFSWCSSLKNVILGSSVKVLEAKAFDNCSSIETITCYSMRPPTVKDEALDGLPYTTIVYVPADAYNIYNMHDIWGLYDVRPMGAVSTETEEIIITPTETTVDVVWPVVADAATYELVIKDKNGNIICTLTFNAKGQLTQIAFNAPSRNNTPQHTQAAGFSFTVTGLEESTEYIYTLTTKDSGGNVIDTQTGSFKTGGGTAVEETERDSATGVRKVMRDGVIYILMPDGRMYDLQGAEVK